MADPRSCDLDPSPGHYFPATSIITIGRRILGGRYLVMRTRLERKAARRMRAVLGNSD